MPDFIETLVALADELDSRDLFQAANIVDAVSQSYAKIVTAQAAGAQRVWVSHQRCWGNCYRQKRATNPKKAAQEVWMECWDEYQESLEDDGKSWNKYADSQVRSLMKTASATFVKSASHEFSQVITQRIAAGGDVGSAVAGYIAEEIDKPQRKLIACAEKLADIADRLYEYEPDLAEKIAVATDQLLKEAGPWQWAKNKAHDKWHDFWGNRRQNKANGMIQQYQAKIQNILAQHPNLKPNTPLYNALVQPIQQQYLRKAQYMSDPSVAAALTQHFQGTGSHMTDMQQQIQQQQQQQQQQNSQNPAANGPQNMYQNMYNQFQQHYQQQFGNWMNNPPAAAGSQQGAAQPSSSGNSTTPASPVMGRNGRPLPNPPPMPQGRPPTPSGSSSSNGAAGRPAVPPGTPPGRPPVPPGSPPPPPGSPPATPVPPGSPPPRTPAGAAAAVPPTPTVGGAPRPPIPVSGTPPQAQSTLNGPVTGKPVPTLPPQPTPPPRKRPPAPQPKGPPIPVP